MFAAYIEEFGGPEAIRCGQLPSPRPGPTDVLVNVEVTAVNQVDTFVRSGAWRTPVPWPFVVGRDLVGTVAETSPGAPGFAVGDRVWCNSMGHAGRSGAAAEQVVVPTDRLYHLPAGVDPSTAVAVAHPAATAHLALFTHGRLRPGETVVVLGGGGNVGSALTLMAARAGARVVATASARDAGRVRALGAAAVVDHHGTDVLPRLRRACPGGAGLFLDTSAANDLDTAVDLLARRGRIVVFSGMRTRPPLPTGALYLKDGSVTGFTISHATTAELAEAAAGVGRLLADGSLRPPAVVTMPLEQAATAHRLLESGDVRGKIVLRVPSEDAAR
ncbi:NADPH:quinone reductase [Streptomyces sp. Ru72]|uniref:NADPH:quinone reductase n=1 Tax=Streptomyces sp. Ru72 TaxID=2080747 RepID=UPI000CDE198C|nr:NADPH:quinone reductase [Streptomyces sp. Ru72]POX48115.1 oxidoreductase [Streptomyces sp. Ru72]